MKEEILEKCTINWASNNMQKTCTNNDDEGQSSEPLNIDDALQNCSKGFKWPEIGIGADGIILPQWAQLKCLEGLIGKCSKPFEKQLTQ